MNEITAKELKVLIENTYIVSIEEIFKTIINTYKIRYKVFGLNEYFECEIECNLRDNLEYLEEFKKQTMDNFEEYIIG